MIKRKRLHSVPVKLTHVLFCSLTLPVFLYQFSPSSSLPLFKQQWLKMVRLHVFSKSVGVTFLEVQWLKPSISTAWCTGSIPGLWTKILHVTDCGQLSKSEYRCLLVLVSVLDDTEAIISEVFLSFYIFHLWLQRPRDVGYYNRLNVEPDMNYKN